MQSDAAAENLTFPGVREQIVPRDDSIKMLQPPWMGCGFGQQQVDDTCGERPADAPLVVTLEPVMP